MATIPYDIGLYLARAAKVGGVEASALNLVAALAQAAMAAGLTPLALNLEEVRGRTERLKRQLVSPIVA